MKSEHESTFVKVLETDSLADIAMIKAVMEAEGIQYYLQGENMKFIRPFDPAVLFVTDEDLEKAVGLLKPLKLSYTWITWG